MGKKVRITRRKIPVARATGCKEVEKYRKRRREKDRARDNGKRELGKGKAE